MAAKLRLLQFCESGGGGKQRVGVEVEGGRVVDVTAVDPAIPTDMRTFLQAFDTNTAAASKSVQQHTHPPHPPKYLRGCGQSPTLSLQNFHYLAIAKQKPEVIQAS